MTAVQRLHDLRMQVEDGNLGDCMIDPARPDDRTVPDMVARELENIVDVLMAEEDRLRKHSCGKIDCCVRTVLGE